MPVPVLVGGIPLDKVTNLTLNEGYQVARIAGSSLAQLVTPTTRTIQIEAVLTGSGRFAVKKALEALALTSRTFAAATAPLMSFVGVPVVSGLTISLDMQITSLRFVQSNTMREALTVSIALEQIPRSSVAAVLGEVADLALAAGSAAIPATT